MFVNFGTGKCPMCGNFGEAVEKEIFHCGRCMVSFNRFSITTAKKLEDYERYLN